jgi:membrane peptidoglycan carboxypeptidase
LNIFLNKVTSADKVTSRWSRRLNVPQHFLEILFIVEDQRFPYHVGIDPLAIARAARSNLYRGRRRQGASTLSQQLYGVRLLSEGKRAYARTLRAKLTQACFGIWIELTQSKSVILEEYLRCVYWGGDIRGLEAASLSYFNKPKATINVAESFFLAERLACPNRFCMKRLDVVLSRKPVIRYLEKNHSSAYEIKELYKARGPQM